MTVHNSNPATSKTVTEHANQNNTEHTEQEHDTVDEPGIEYACPYCDHTYPTEALARVHVTRSQHAEHANKNGFMPETVITKQHTETRDELDTLTTRPREWNLTRDIQHEHVKPHLKHKPLEHQLIITTAAQHATETEYKTLHEHVTETLNEHEHTDPVSYATTRRVTRAYFRPTEHEHDQQRYNQPATHNHDNNDNNENTASNTNTDTSREESENTEPSDETVTRAFRNATPRQQALIIATLAHPNEPNTEIAARINVAQSYPTQVQSKYEHVLTALDNAITNTVNTTGRTRAQAIVHETLPRLSTDRVKELHQHGLLENINAPFTEHMQHANELRQIKNTTSTEDTGENREVRETRDTSTDTNDDEHEHEHRNTELNDKAITKQDSPLTASPYDTAPEPDHDALTNTTATTPTTAPMSTDTDSTAPENNTAHDNDTDSTQGTGENTSDKGEEHTVPVSEIERLRDRVAFAVQIASRDTQLQHAHHANATENTANTDDDASDGHTQTQQTTLPNTSTRHTRHAPNTSTWRQAFAAEILAEINRVLTTTSETREQATE